jgi:hypothetical protein
MIVYDLRCRRGHVFEAWFRDSAAYDEQARVGEVACPSCGSKKVEKAPMAPRVAKGRGGEEPDAAVAKAAETRRAMLELRRHVEENFDYVGGEFAEEARRIHYGDTDPRDIYGETSEEEADTLRDEGIPFSRVLGPTRYDS